MYSVTVLTITVSLPLQKVDAALSQDQNFVDFAKWGVEQQMENLCWTRICNRDGHVFSLTALDLQVQDDTVWPQKPHMAVTLYRMKTEGWTNLKRASWQDPYWCFNRLLSVRLDPVSVHFMRWTWICLTLAAANHAHQNIDRGPEIWPLSVILSIKSSSKQTLTSMITNQL